MIIIWSDLAINLGNHNRSIKAYTIPVESAIQVKDMMMYDRNLNLTWSLCLKLRFRLRENEATIHQKSLMIFDGMMGRDNEVSSINKQQSMIAQIVDKIRYKRACIISFFACLRRCVYGTCFSMIYFFINSRCLYW